MLITVVGSSGSVSGPDSAASCYLVQAEADGEVTSVVLDMGSGAYGHLTRYLDPGALDAVLLSHLHADHVVDMTSLEVHLKYAPSGPYTPMVVYGPDGTEQRLRELTGFCSSPPKNDTAPYPYTFRGWAEGTAFEVGCLTIEVFEVVHPVPAYAMRITGPAEAGGEPKVVTYSGDTDMCEGLIHAARGADLFLCEAAFEEGRDTVRGIHLTGRRAGEAASKADAAHLALTHIPPWTSSETIRAEAASSYAGPIDVATPGTRWRL